MGRRSQRPIGRTRTSSYNTSSTSRDNQDTSVAESDAARTQDTESSVHNDRGISSRIEVVNSNRRRKRRGLPASMSHDTTSQQTVSSGATTDWWAIKDIIDERRSARDPKKKEYLVDWCPNKDTGEKYPPNWEPEQNVTLSARIAWHRQKLQERKAPEKRSRKSRQRSKKPAVNKQASSGATDDSSQPVLPPDQRKRPRHLPSTAFESDDNVDESSLETPGPDSLETSFVEVLIPHKLEIDTSEYLSYSDSQNTNSQSQSISAQEVEDDLIHFPNDSQRTIPDSQEWDSVPQQSTEAHPVEVPDSQDISSLATGSGSVLHQPSVEQFTVTGGSSIPSRQLDQDSFSRVPSLTPDNSVNLDSVALELEDQHSQSALQESSQPGFLTQDPDSNYHPLPRGQEPETVPDSTQVSSEPAIEVSQTLSGPSQAAQIVPPPFALTPLGQFDQGSSASSGVIPDTTPRYHQASPSGEHILGTRPRSSSLSPSSPASPSVGASRFLSNRVPSIASRASPVPKTSPRMSSSDTPKRSTREILREAALSGFSQPLGFDQAETSGHQQEVSGGASSAAPESSLALGAEASSSANIPVPTIATTTNVADTETLESALDAQPAVQIGSEPQPDIALHITPVDDSIAGPLLELQQAEPLLAIPESVAGPFLGPEATDELPRTVSPSEISRSVEPELSQLQMQMQIDEPLSLGLNDQELEEEAAAPETASLSGEEEDSPAAETNEYLVTLQMPANVMQLYVDTYNSHKREIEVFSDACRESQEVDAEILAKIDGLLEQLYRLCDYPGETSPETIRQMSSQDLAKHAITSNVKLFFVGQLIEKLATSNKKLLVIARSTELVGYLEAIINSIGDVAYSKTDLDAIKDRGSEPELAVVLAQAEQEIKDPGNFDVVIALDSSFTSSGVATRLEAMPVGAKPMVITLVNTYTIEHLDLAVPTDLDALQRKNAMLISLYHSRAYVSHYEDDVPADRIAALFAGYILEAEPDTFFDWKPQEVPHILLDFYGTAQRTQPDADPDSRKRKLDDPEDVSAKRPRHSMTQGDLDETVHSQVAPDPSQVRVTVPQAQLDAKDATIGELQERVKEHEELAIITAKQIKEMSKQIKSHENTANTIQQRLMEAQLEHASAEKLRKVADENARATDGLLKSVDDKYTQMEEKYRQVVEERSSEQTFARLTAVGKELEDAQNKIKELERRLKNKDGDLEYTRSVLQTQRQEAQQTMSENQELREELQKLKAERAQDLVKVQSINAANGQKEMQRLVHEAQSIARDREAETDRAKEELKMLKNGRRETRGASVPRSPRMGVMSPRNGRGGMGTIASTAASAGASRGTSPAHLTPFDQVGVPPAVPGSQFFPPPTSTNGRFNHLRDFP